MIEPGVFVGTVRHRRRAPLPHAFSYRVFMVLLDVDRIPELMQVSPVLGINRWNWATFDDRDYLGDQTGSLRERLRTDAARHGLVLPSGTAMLLTNLRYLGYGFNPVSLFYLFDPDDTLQVVLAEVSNTFGQTQRYWLQRIGSSSNFRAATPKTMRVSPFLPIDLEYRFSLTVPGRSLVAHIETWDDDRLLLDATLTLRRRPWTAFEIHRQLCRVPAMTLKVMAAIHWQALRLWWKGVAPVPAEALPR